jgi:hypothetical protein
MRSFRVKADHEPQPGLVALGSILYFPFRLLLNVGRVAIWVAVPLGAPWLLSRLFHWPIAWTYAVWEMGAATVLVISMTLRSGDDHPPPTVDEWLADVFFAGHWPIVFLGYAIVHPWSLLRARLSGKAQAEEDRTAILANGPSACDAAVSAPAPGAGDTVRSTRSAPPCPAAAPRP